MPGIWYTYFTELFSLWYGCYDYYLTGVEGNVIGTFVSWVS